ncbi:AAA family ATPase [Nocardioides flavescens]|uniref:AAA family ATPase n=1 Tax=Nocardioides flavescens TaxID=2691959 RepID=A0A6L7EMX6_9ACTN|nr:AAA family ATPase [Nocardioides flavescens]
MTPPLVLHLNGLPGVGKSTLARHWAQTHPGTLLLDIDVLRTWVSGWREDFAATGERVRTTALAALAAYVADGGDVVLPQLLADPAQVARFERAAIEAGGRFVHVMVEADDAAARFAARERDEPWLEVVHALVATAGPGHLEGYAARLDGLRPDLRLATTTGDVDGSCAELERRLVSLGWCPRSPGDGA